MKYMQTICCLFCILNVSAQKIKKEDTARLFMRDVVITMDSTIEYNNLGSGTNMVDFVKIPKGLRIIAVDNVFRILNFDEYEDNALNGVHLEFFAPSNLPKAKGSYKDNKKDGEWFYWSEKGNLLRREIWQRGKLMKTIK